jgi:ribosomal protein S13
MLGGTTMIGKRSNKKVMEKYTKLSMNERVKAITKEKTKTLTNSIKGWLTTSKYIPDNINKIDKLIEKSNNLKKFYRELSVDSRSHETALAMQ